MASSKSSWADEADTDSSDDESNVQPSKLQKWSNMQVKKEPVTLQQKEVPKQQTKQKKQTKATKETTQDIDSGSSETKITAKIQMTKKKQSAAANILEPSVLRARVKSMALQITDDKEIANSVVEKFFEVQDGKFADSMSDANMPTIGHEIVQKFVKKALKKKGGHILAFEPDPFLCKYLTQNVRTNGLTQIEILPKAVWSSNTSLPFLSDGADGGRVSSVSNGISVEAVMLKQFLDRGVDFLKIDIEGNELEVLKSCSDSLKKVSKIFLEYHSFKDSNQQLSNLLKILEDNHFRYFLNSATQRTKPFAFKSNEEMDLQVNIYAWKN